MRMRCMQGVRRRSSDAIYGAANNSSSAPLSQKHTAKAHLHVLAVRVEQLLHDLLLVRRQRLGRRLAALARLPRERAVLWQEGGRRRGR